jgi:hypothetical protein
VSSHPHIESVLPEGQPDAVFEAGRHGRLSDGRLYEGLPSDGRSSEGLSSEGLRQQRLRSCTRPLPPRPSRDCLERACRIALMEGEGPVSTEVIYDRIVRRGSITFLGYRRPFRAIASAMSALSKRGEVLTTVGTNGSRVRRRDLKRLWTRAVVEPGGR